MKLAGRIITLVLLLIAIGSQPVLAADFPAPKGYVNDFASLLSDSTAMQLEEQLVSLEKDTTAEVAVVTVGSLEGASIEQYAADLFDAWDIGKKDKNNGVLFLIAYSDHKVRIEVGYGLEPVITDGRTGRILDNEVIPYFKNNDYNQGVRNGVAALERLIREGSPPTMVEENPIQGALQGFHLSTTLLVVLGISTIYVLGFMARTRSIWLGGIWGVILGLALGFGFGSLLTIILMPIGMGVFGTFLDAIMSRNYKSRSSRGLPSGWFSSRGGFSGGSGGGGFGGFGGGMSGGGGASRGW
jgi:uncharacterized protein